MTGDDSRHALDDSTIELGRRELDKIRARWRDSGEGQASERPAEIVESTPEGTADDDLSVDKMVAEMAAGAERERLETRVRQLEQEAAELRREVAQLRASLAAVLDAAASGLRSSEQEDVCRRAGD